MKKSEKVILVATLTAAGLILGGALLWAGWANMVSHYQEKARREAAEKQEVEKLNQERREQWKAYLLTPEGQAEVKRRQEEERKRLAEEMKKIDRVEVSAWDGSVDEAKKFIARSVRDPSSVKYNQWKNFTNDTNHITTVNFTATNGFGGPSRETWVFSFEKLTGKLQTVFDGNKFLYDAIGSEVK
jgi:hypothetical protein